MAILMHAGPRGMTKEMYDEAIRRLKEYGSHALPAQHVLIAYGDPNDIELLAVWESREDYERFLQEVLPITAAPVGIDLTGFDFYEVHDLVLSRQYAEQ